MVNKTFVLTFVEIKKEYLQGILKLKEGGWISAQMKKMTASQKGGDSQGRSGCAAVLEGQLGTPLHESPLAGR